MNSKFKNHLKYLPYWDISVILFCGIFLSLAYVRYQLGWLILLSPVAFIWYINNLNNRKLTSKQFIMRVWAVGVVFFTITVSWIYRINATDLLSDPWLRWLFLFITLAIIVLVFSIGFLFFAYLIRKLKISLQNPISFVLLPAIWIVGEFIRSFLFSIVSFGSGA
ncbi:MAG: hypothetical protein NTY56_01855, partial [Patescibacteria group bacterium]|nr:hypothetical protein [Patescibacteria group bacterium]